MLHSMNENSPKVKVEKIESFYKLWTPPYCSETGI